MIKTSVVILNWNGLPFLKKFLGDVMKYSLDQNTEVIIADNGSTDESAEWLSANFKDAGFISTGQNLGFAGGYNYALKQIESEYYVLLNTDIQVTEGWLSPLVRFMDENPDVASCQPKIRSYHQRDHFEYARVLPADLLTNTDSHSVAVVFSGILKKTWVSITMLPIFSGRPEPV